MIKKLLSKWYLFAVWALISVFFWVWVANLLTKPSAEEKVGVFVCSESCDREQLINKLQSACPEYVLQLDFKWVAPSDGMFPVYYDSFAVYESDLIILPEYKLTEISYVDFYGFSEDVAKSLFGATELYKAENGCAYGVKIDTLKCLGEQGGNADYYAFFNKNSLHLGELGNSKLDGAVALARVFI